MKSFKSFLGHIDKFQRLHPIVSFPLAVIKRFGDEEAGKHAALITYYAFVSVFPLIMILLSILGVVSLNNPELEQKISQNVFRLFPALGSELQNNIHAIRSSGWSLLLQALVLLYGARGLASILQSTFNELWNIDKKHRPNFLNDNLRSFGMMAAVGLGMILGTAVSLGLSSVLSIGLLGTVIITILNLCVTFGLFIAVFRLGTSARIGTQKLLLGAFIATIGMIIIQRLGGIIMAGQLPRLEGSYGTFALALGMLFWIYLQAQILLYALVITIVQTEKDWPKKIF